MTLFMSVFLVTDKALPSPSENDRTDLLEQFPKLQKKILNGKNFYSKSKQLIKTSKEFPATKNYGPHLERQSRGASSLFTKMNQE
jgi:hypothetical protein